MHLDRILYLLLTFAAVCIAYEQKVRDAITAGDGYLQRIPRPDQAEDTSLRCDVEEKLTVKRGNLQGPRGSVNRVLQKVDVPRNNKWMPIDAAFPKHPPPSPMSVATTRCLGAYNPDGAIVYDDIVIDLKPENNAGLGYSIADVSWAFYKRVCDADQGVQENQGSYNNIKYIANSNVVSGGSTEVFNTFLPPRSEEVQTFTPDRTQATNWDAFRAFMGLDNGRVVKNLLTFHNQEMGRKEIEEIRVWRSGTRNFLVFVLKNWP